MAEITGFWQSNLRDLLGIACETVREIQLMSSGKMVYLECEDVLPLTSFYERNGFFRFANRNLDGDERDLSQTPYLVQMIKYFNTVSLLKPRLMCYNMSGDENEEIRDNH